MGKRKRKTAKKTKGLSLAITSSSTEQQHAPRKRGRPRKVVAVGSKEDKEEIQRITTVQEQPSESKKDEAIEGEEEQVLGKSTEVECSENDVENKEALLQHHQPLRRKRARKRNKPTRSS